MMSDRTLSGLTVRASKRPRALATGWLAAGFAVWMVSLAVSIHMNNDLRALLDREDAQALEQSERAFDSLVDQKLIHLRSEAAVLAEDARVRSTVLTPQFDPESAVDVLTELKKSANADLVAILDASGRVRAVTGADEMKNLDLSTSSLVKAGLENPAAYIWTFSQQVRLLGVAPVQLGDQVLAMFMMGFDLDASSLADIGSALGARGGAFVGDALVASSSKEAGVQALLAAAAAKDAGTHELLHEGRAFVARNSRPKQSAGAIKMVWVVEKHHEAKQLLLVRGFAWTPAVLVGLSFLMMLAFAWRRSAEVH